MSFLTPQFFAPKALASRLNTPMKRGLAALGVLAFGLGIVIAAAPPAGSVIGNQATATYTDSTGNPRTSTSNLVQTTVAQVNNFLLAANATKYVAPGGTVYFPHTITNTGNGADSYQLTAADVAGGPASSLCTNGTPASPLPAGCNVFIYPDADGNGIADSNVFLTSATTLTTPLVAANGTYKFVMGVFWPAGTAAVTDEQITLTATSVGTVNNLGTGAAVVVTNTDTIKVSLGPVIAVTKTLSVTSGSRSTAACGTPFAASANCFNTTVTLNYTNTGGAAAANVTLTDVIGSGLTAGMRYVPNSGSWSGCPSSVLTDANTAEPAACVNGGAAITYDFNVTAANRVTAVIPNVAPGQTGTLSFVVNISNTAAIGVTTTSNSAGYSYSDGGTAVSGVTGTATYNVSASAGVVANSNSTSALNILATDNLVNYAPAAGVPQGSVIWFPNRIWNTGTTTDTFDIAPSITLTATPFPVGTPISFYADGAPPAANCAAPAPDVVAPASLGSALTDSSGNGTPDTGPIGAGLCKIVWTRVALLSNSTGGPYSFAKTARSVNDPAISDDVTDSLGSIQARVVDLTNGVQVGTSTITQLATVGTGFQGGAVTPATVTTNTGVQPGSTTRFNLIVSNVTGAVGTGDNYDLSAWNNYSALATFTSPFGTAASAGYTVAYFAGACPASGAATGTAITNTGNIVVGSNKPVCAQVTVPANATAGTVDIFFRVESQASVSYAAPYAGFDVKHDAFVIASTSVITITPDRSGSTVAGGNVVYTHQVCNQGNSNAYVGLNSSNSAAGSFSNGLWLDLDASGTVNTGDVAIPANGTILVPANTCVNVIDNVFASAGTAAGATNVSTITASVSTVAPTTLPTATTVGTALGGTVSTAGTATDTTVLVTGDVTLLKEQREVTCTGGTGGVGVSGANGTYTVGNLPAKVNPGACIQYRITATNTGSTPANNLNITDSTPSYTTLNGFACTGTASTGTVPATITFTITGGYGTLNFLTPVTLPSNGTAIMVFCVKVDQ